MIKLKIKALSVNKAWRGRRFKTDDYKAFERTMLLILPKTKKDLTGNLKVSIKYGFSSKLSDIDNPCKLVLDCLVKKYGFDDRQIFELNQTKEIVKKGSDYISFEINRI
jgi:Holliday junction resolvase RusA-like endonuclease